MLLKGSLQRTFANILVQCIRLFATLSGQGIESQKEFALWGRVSQIIDGRFKEMTVFELANRRGKT